MEEAASETLYLMLFWDRPLAEDQTETFIAFTSLDHTVIALWLKDKAADLHILA